MSGTSTGTPLKRPWARTNVAPGSELGAIVMVVAGSRPRSSAAAASTATRPTKRSTGSPAMKPRPETLTVEPAVACPGAMVIVGVTTMPRGELAVPPLVATTMVPRAAFAGALAVMARRERTVYFSASPAIVTDLTCTKLRPETLILPPGVTTAGPTEVITGGGGGGAAWPAVGSAVAKVASSVISTATPSAMGRRFVASKGVLGTCTGSRDR